MAIASLQGLAWPQASCRAAQPSVLASLGIAGIDALQAHTHLGGVHHSHQLLGDVQLGLVLFERHHCTDTSTSPAMSWPPCAHNCRHDAHARCIDGSEQAKRSPAAMLLQAIRCRRIATCHSRNLARAPPGMAHKSKGHTRRHELRTTDRYPARLPRFPTP